MTSNELTSDRIADFAHADQDDAMFSVLLEAVEELILERVGPPESTRMPLSLRDLALMLAVKRAWDMYKSANGLIQYTPDGEITYLPADILKPAEPLMRPYKKLGAVG